MKPLISLTALALALGCSAAQAQYTNGIVKIGVLNDMSGTYADLSGRGSVIAARMAARISVPPRRHEGLTSSAPAIRTSRRSGRRRETRRLIPLAAHPLGRSHKLKRRAVVRHDIVFGATGHFFLQAVPLDGIELLLGEQREALGIAHLRHWIVGALGEGDRVGNLRCLDVPQEFQRERRKIWIVDR